MAEIKLLDQSTINQIAAGEVIDRPSSVVKELLENAMDAKATAITVEIKNGGIDLIRITDNGCGIEKSQVPMAFKRHATSKIHDISDLLDIGSLGFRGEALSSIAAVAQVELITKPAETMLGVSYRIEDGEEKSVTDIGAPDGTTILVRNLFAHVPARKKFLKTAATEGNYISQLLENMAMLRPDISLRFIHNGQNKLYTSGNGRLKDLIYTIYGREISSNLLEVSFECPLFSVSGFLGKPILSRGNRSFENYYINGRFVKSRLISLAIEQAYKPFMMQHRYPFTVLHIQIRPELIDVNVHPSKMEVRFQQENQIYDLLVSALENTLRGKELIPDASVQGTAKRPEPLARKLPEAFEKRRLEAREEILPRPPASPGGQSPFPISAPGSTVLTDTVRNGTALNNASPDRDVQNDTAQFCAAQNGTGQSQLAQNAAAQCSRPENAAQVKEPDRAYTASGIHKRIGQENVQETLFTEPLLSEKARIHHKLIGQLFETYWLIQYADKLYIMDQHAAHEKVNYERMVAAYRKKERITQFVSPPMIISLTTAEQAVLLEYQEVFEQIGFTIEPYGGKEYAISEVPANLYGVNEKELFIEMLSELEERGSLSPSELIAARLASMSCKAAIKGNQRISFEEADALISQLLTLDNPYACPHGRPTIITMSKYELEKKFKRII